MQYLNFARFVVTLKIQSRSSKKLGKRVKPRVIVSHMLFREAKKLKINSYVYDQRIRAMSRCDWLLPSTIRKKQRLLRDHERTKEIKEK